MYSKCVFYKINDTNTVKFTIFYAYTVYAKILSRTTIFKIDNKKKCFFLSSISACDTEDWSDAKIGINYFLKCTTNFWMVVYKNTYAHFYITKQWNTLHKRHSIHKHKKHTNITQIKQGPTHKICMNVAHTSFTTQNDRKHIFKKSPWKQQNTLYSCL